MRVPVRRAPRLVRALALVASLAATPTLARADGDASLAPTTEPDTVDIVDTVDTTTAADPLDGLRAALGDEPAELDADRLRFDRAKLQVIAEGRARLARGGLVIHADQLRYDRRAGRVFAEGHVLAVEGTTVFSCESVTLDVPALSGVLVGGRLHAKGEVDASTLRLAPPEQVLSLGVDLARLSATRLERTGARTFRVEGARFTPCRCSDDTLGAWAVTASTADVDVEAGAWLTWPVFRVSEVPVFALPVIYVPLGERRTGLLMPTGTYTAPSGFRARLPLYVTLGRSADLTLNAEVWTARGPAPGLELRWAPARDVSGQLELQTLVDFGVLGPRSAVDWSWGGDPRVRFALGGRHRGPALDGWLGVDLSLVGDAAWIAELGGAFLTRQAEENVSRATWTTAPREDVRVAVGLALRQDVRTRWYGGLSLAALRDVSLFSSEVGPLTERVAAGAMIDPAARGPGDVRQRLVDVRVDALPHTLVDGPLRVVGATRLALAGLVAPSLERAQLARVDLRPSLLAALPLVAPLALDAELALRLTAWAGTEGARTLDATPEPGLTAGRVAPVLRAGAALPMHTRLGGWLHTLRPSARWALVPTTSGDAPPSFDTRDEIDRLAPGHQVLGSITAELWPAPGVAGAPLAAAPLLALDVGLGRELGLGTSTPARTSELVARAALAPVLVDGLTTRLGGRVILPVEGDGAWTPALAVGTLDLGWRTAARLNASFGDFGVYAPRASLVDPELLVPAARATDGLYAASAAATQAQVLPWVRSRSLALDVSGQPFAALEVGASLGLDFPVASPFEVPAGLGFDAVSVRNVGGRVALRSSCACWNLGVAVSVARDRQYRPDVSFVFDLGQLGGVFP